MARLSKSNPMRVVCDDLGCPETFGRIVDVKPEQCGPLLPIGLPPGRWLIMEPGWLPQYSPPVWVKPKPRFQERRPYRPGRQNPAATRHIIVSLPVRITCPRCGLPQSLEAEKLQLKGLPEGQLELRWPKALGKRSRYLTSREIGEKEALQLLDTGLNAMSH
jgi:hypothetical protein